MARFKSTGEEFAESFFGGLSRAVESFPESVRQNREDETKRKLVTFEALMGIERQRLRREEFNKGMAQLKLRFDIHNRGLLRQAGEDKALADTESRFLEKFPDRGQALLDAKRLGIPLTESTLPEFGFEKPPKEEKEPSLTKLLPKARLVLNNQVATVNRKIKSQENENTRLLALLTKRLKEDKGFFAERLSDVGIKGKTEADILKILESQVGEPLDIPAGTSKEARSLFESINSIRVKLSNLEKERKKLQSRGNLFKLAGDIKKELKAFDDPEFSAALDEIMAQSGFEDANLKVTERGLDKYLSDKPNIQKYKSLFMNILGINNGN